MSIGAYKYLVKGAFEGTFYTHQNDPITSVSQIPAGDEHKIVIHRGIISHATNITETQYSEAQGLNFDEVKNVEIQRSPYWSVENDRIFTLNGLKLTDIEILHVGNVDGKTRATIKGLAYSKVSHMEFHEYEKPNEYDSKEEENLSKNHWNDHRWFKNGGCSDLLNRNSLNGYNIKGCNTPQGCWRWLGLLMLLLLLLWLIGRCSELGKNLHCYYDQWKEKREISRLENERDKLKDKIERTKQKIPPCGKISDPNGKNTPKTYTFDLGKNSGNVILNYNMYQIPDRIEVIYDGKLVDVTNDQSFDPIIVHRKKYNLDYLIPMGYAQGKGSLSNFNYVYDKNKPTEMLVRVIPSKEFETTEWKIDIFCP